jgi:L-fuconolactonase
MIIDTHHHLWNYNQEEYGWMDESMTELRRDYLPGDLGPELQKAGTSGTIVVQARQSREETLWLLDQAVEHSFIKGVVGWLDLCSPELDRELEKLSAHPELVGLRHVIHDEPEDDFMLRPDFMNGIAQLERYKLVYDLLLFPRHLEHAAELVKAFPGQRFVLDHLGKPFIKSGKMEPWKTKIELLAKHSNIWCKLSGMVTEADHQHWQYQDLLPYMEVVISAFGPGRVMLGSDWPVCRLAGEYTEVMAIARRFIEPLRPEDREKIYYQNAIECYQLKN